jgi:hypothetical protein
VQLAEARIIENAVSKEPQPLTKPDERSEKLTDEAVAQLNVSLTNCHKVVSDYRATLLHKPRRRADNPKRD